MNSDSVWRRDRCTRRYDLVHVRVQSASVLVAGYRIFGNLHRDLHDCQLLGATFLGHRKAVKSLFLFSFTLICVHTGYPSIVLYR